MVREIMKDPMFLSVRSTDAVKANTGFTAQIIQHEIDMTNGILI